MSERVKYAIAAKTFLHWHVSRLIVILAVVVHNFWNIYITSNTHDRVQTSHTWVLHHYRLFICAESDTESFKDQIFLNRYQDFFRDKIFHTPQKNSNSPETETETKTKSFEYILTISGQVYNY